MYNLLSRFYPKCPMNDNAIRSLILRLNLNKNPGRKYLDLQSNSLDMETLLNIVVIIYPYYIYNSILEYLLKKKYIFSCGLC